MNGAAGPVSARADDLIAWAETQLAPVSASSRLEAEVLLAESAGIRRASVIAHPERRLTADQAARLETSVERRSRGEPLAYILGNKEFYSLALSVRPAVLVPRPETESLVEAVLAQLGESRTRVLDLGTGSGAIALALKHARPDLDVWAVDCDPAALEVAAANARNLDLEVRWLVSDWFSSLAGEQFELIVSNPPYVPSDDRHFDSALAFEPRIALDGGADGLDGFREILRSADDHLAPRGRLLFEHGFDQREALEALARASGFQLEAAIDDLAGLPRVAVFSAATE